jgi:hypothetical protein
MTLGNNVIAGVNKLFAGVNDTTDKFFIGVPLTKLSAN